MKYSHSSRRGKNGFYDRDHHAQLGHRLKLGRCTLGWSIAAASRYFQVTERTWHNWETGAHRIPFAVYKLCRVLARMELPGDAWAGWSFQGASLITPEGRQIEPHDSSWWSLLVRNAHSFSSAFNEASKLRQVVAELKATAVQTTASGEAAAFDCTKVAGLVPSKTNRVSINSSTSQNDVIMTPWPILCDSPQPLTHLHAPRPTPLESALTPSSVLPWMPICGVQLTAKRLPQGPHHVTKAHLKQLSPKPGIRANPPRPVAHNDHSPDLKNKPPTKPENANSQPSIPSARLAGAGATKPASAARGGK